MPLSEYERKLLQELERDLVAEDPGLARKLESGWPVGRSAPRKAVDMVAAMTGMALIILGITVQVPIVGGIGFFLMLAGVAGFLVRRPHFGPG